MTDRLYSVSYDQWKERMVESYNKISDALSQTLNAHITAHVKLEEGLYATQYDNNKTVLVNYRDIDLNFEGTKVPAKGYAVMTGEVTGIE